MSHLWFSWQRQRDMRRVSLPRWCRQQLTPKRLCVSIRLHGVTSPKGKLPSTNCHIATRFLAFSNNRTAWRVHKEQSSDILQRQTWGLGPGRIVTKLQNNSQNPVKQSAKGTNNLQNDRLCGPLTPPPTNWHPRALRCRHGFPGRHPLQHIATARPQGTQGNSNFGHSDQWRNRRTADPLVIQHRLLFCC